MFPTCEVARSETDGLGMVVLGSHHHVKAMRADHRASKKAQLPSMGRVLTLPAVSNLADHGLLWAVVAGLLGVHPGPKGAPQFEASVATGRLI